MVIKNTTLPNMTSSYKITTPILWNNRQFEFIFENNLRSENIELSIRTLDDNSDIVYVLKNAVLSQDIDLADLIYSELWDGRLYIIQNNLQPKLITIDNLSNDFFMLLATEDEFE